MKKSLFKNILVSIMVPVMIMIIFVGCSDTNSDLQGTKYDKNISIVQEGCPVLIPHITYQEAYDNFFLNPEWRGFESEDGLDIVEFSGECTFFDEDATVYIQFTLEEDDLFYLTYAAFTVGDEVVEADEDLFMELTFNPFETYSEDVLGEPLDEEIYYQYAEAYDLLE